MSARLLAVGVPPQVASATSAFMITFTSSADVVHYLFQGVLSPDPGYVVWALCLGFCSALTGRLLAVHVTSRMNHPSVIVFALGAILYISMGLLILRSAESKASWTFGDPCSGGHNYCSGHNYSSLDLLALS